MCQAGFVPDFRLLRLQMVQWGAALRAVKAVCIFLYPETAGSRP